MIEAFKIGVALNMSSNAFGVLSELGKKFESLERLMKGATDGIKGFEKSLGGLASADRKLSDLQKRLTKISETKFGNTGDLSKMLTGTRELAEAATQMERAWKGTAEAMAQGARASGRMRMPRGSSGGGGGEGANDSWPWNQSSRNAYPNAVWENANRNQVSRSMDQDAAYLNANNDSRYHVARSLAERENSDLDARYRNDRALAERHNADMERIAAAKKSAFRHTFGSEHSDLAMTAMAAGGTGEQVLAFGGHMFEAGVEPGDIRSMLTQDDRVTPAQADAAMRAAWQATRDAPGTLYSKNAEMLLDLTNLAGGLENGKKALSGFGQLSEVLAVVDRAHGGKGDPTYAAGKALDIFGSMIEEHRDPNTGEMVQSIDMDRLTKTLQAMTRVAVRTQGRVGPDQYLSFAKTARVAGMHLTDEFLYEELPNLLQTTGGPRTGTALMSMMQVFNHSMTKKNMDGMIKYGLAPADAVTHDLDPDDPKHRKRVWNVHTDKIYDLDLANTDPLKYVEAMKKRMAAKGYDTGDQQVLATLQFAQRGTIMGVLGDIIKDVVAMKREQEGIQHTTGGDEKDILAHMRDSSPTQRIREFNAAWSNMMAAFGEAIMPTAIKLMNSITTELNKFGEWAHNHPDTAEHLVKIAAGFAVVATAIGTLSAALWLYMPAFKLAAALMKGLSKGSLKGALEQLAKDDVEHMGASGGLKEAIKKAMPLGEGALASVAAPAAAAAAAGAATYYSSKAVNESLARNPALQGYHPVMGPGGLMMMPDSPPALTRSVAPPSGPSENTTIKGDVNLDGKKVGTWLGKAMGSGAAKPTTGPTGFDASQAAAYQAIPGGF